MKKLTLTLCVSVLIMLVLVGLWWLFSTFYILDALIIVHLVLVGLNFILAMIVDGVFK